MIIQSLAMGLMLSGAQQETTQEAEPQAAPIVFVELWSAKPAWVAMSDEEQAAYIDRIGESIAGLQDQGVELVHTAIADPETDLDAGYDYIAVLRMPDEETARAFEAQVRADGFYDYFEQINASGEIVPPPLVFSAMIEE
jgi:hypothetical protein